VIPDQEIHEPAFIWTQWKKRQHHETLQEKVGKTKKLESGDEPPVRQFKIYNRLEDNFHLNNKKALFRNIVHYYEAVLKQDPFTVIPETYHVSNPQFEQDP